MQILTVTSDPTTSACVLRECTRDCSFPFLTFLLNSCTREIINPKRKRLACLAFVVVFHVICLIERGWGVKICTMYVCTPPQYMWGNAQVGAGSVGRQGSPWSAAAALLQPWGAHSVLKQSLSMTK